MFTITSHGTKNVRFEYDEQEGTHWLDVYIESRDSKEEKCLTLFLEPGFTLADVFGQAIGSVIAEETLHIPSK